MIPVGQAALDRAMECCAGRHEPDLDLALTFRGSDVSKQVLCLLEMHPTDQPENKVRLQVCRHCLCLYVEKPKKDSTDNDQTESGDR